MDAVTIVFKRCANILRINQGRCLSSSMNHRFLVSRSYVCVRRRKTYTYVFRRYCGIGNGAAIDGDSQNRNNVSENSSCYSLRTHTCGELRSWHKDCQVQLFGWVEFIRFEKFIVLRDAYGSVQILLSGMPAEDCAVTESINVESVVGVKGTVVLRPPDKVNPKMSTGEVEIAATSITILGLAPQTLPFNIRRYQNVWPTELLSMKYRYLYLRYPHMQKMLRLRSSFLHSVREFLIHKHFVDVETPTLFRRTPGGAQEFVVPTHNPGLFYSLVQSPQQFKQLLMVGGLDRYFQIARCYRDEGSRPDRQPEFTQLDIELSFVDREGVMSLIEDLVVACWPDNHGDLSVPFPRIPFCDAFSQYGTDKPDLRFDSRIIDVTHLIEWTKSAEGDTLFDKNDFTCQAVIFHNAASISSRSKWKEMQKQAEVQWPLVRLLLVPITRSEDVSKAVGYFITEKSVENVLLDLNLKKEDLLILGLGPRNSVLKMLGALRICVADFLENHGLLLRERGYHFSWIVDFPLFEEDENGSLTSAHHPFTQPHPEDLHLLDSDALKVRGLHYDLVLNGAEIGGGSIRISNVELQRHILHSHLNIKTDTLQHLLNALSFGCPPHGGIALGIDRIIASICEAKSIRDVIAFPKGSNGQDIMASAPAPLSLEDAQWYGLPTQTRTTQN